MKPNGLPKRWTREDSDYLEHASGKVSAREIAKHLGRTEKSVTARLHRLRNAEYIKLMRCGYSRTEAKHMIEGAVYEG